MGNPIDGLKRRIVANGASTLYGMLVVAVGQIAMVPLFLQSWGAEVYGEWLTISAIPAYLSLSDFGFGQVAANRIALGAAAADCSSALRTLHSIWAFQLGLAGALPVLVVGSAASFPVRSWLGLTHLGYDELIVALAGLTVYVMLNMLAGVVQAVYRAKLQNARGAFLGNTVRLLEIAASIAVLLSGGSVTAMVGAMVTVRVVGLLFLRRDAARLGPEYPLGVSQASWAELKVLGHPAVGHMGLAIGSALQLQGFLLAVGHALGPQAVVQFSVLRTATRFCVQLILVINGAIYPEFTTLVAANTLEKAREVHRLAVQCSTWMGVAYASTLVIVAPWLVPFWTAGKVQNSPPLLALLATAVVLGCIWSTSSVVLSSTNNHVRLGWIYSIAAAVSLVASALAVHAGGGLLSVALGLIALDLAVVLYVLPASCALLRDRVVDALVDILSGRALRKRLRLVLPLRT